MSKLFWVDSETTGLNCKTNDIISLGYLVEIDGEIVDSGEIFCQPFDYNTINQAALEVNNLSIAKIKEFPTPQETYNKLIKVLDKYVDRYDKTDKFSPAGFNVGFDVGFLREFFFKNNDKYYGAFFDYHLLSIDSLLYLFDYQGLIKLENYKLITVAKHFNIEFSAHNALEDIRVTRQIFYKLLEYFK